MRYSSVAPAMAARLGVSRAVTSMGCPGVTGPSGSLLRLWKGHWQRMHQYGLMFLVLHGLVRHRQSVQRQIGARCAQYWTAARCRPACVSMAELAEAGTAAIGGRRALLLGRSTAKHSTDLSRSVPPWCCNNPAHPRKTGHLLAGAQSWAARVSQQTVKPPP